MQEPRTICNIPKYHMQEPLKRSKRDPKTGIRLDYPLLQESNFLTLERIRVQTEGFLKAFLLTLLISKCSEC